MSAVGSAKTPWDVLQLILRTDAATQRVTFYERTPGPTQGERIELSGKVLANWVCKAANLLSEEFDVEEGTRVGVHLPAAHWRTAYWVLAAWSLGATVVFVDADADSTPTPPTDVDVLVTCLPGESDADVVVTLAMLARSADVDVPAGAIDEAKELSTFADVFSPFSTPASNAVALEHNDRTWTFADLVAPGTLEAPGRVYLPTPNPAMLMQSWATGGSIVLVRGEIAADDLQHVLDQESAVTA